jgi:malate dehydrogenase
MNVPVKEIESLVLGGHGDTMVAMVNPTKIKSKPLKQFLQEGKLKKKD